MNTTDDKQPPIRKVNCPTCGVEVLWKEENRFRPFCSEKCQLIDFGEWAAERHSIPVEDKDNLSFPDGDAES